MKKKLCFYLKIKARERKFEEHRDRLFRGDRVNFTGK